MPHSGETRSSEPAQALTLADEAAWRLREASLVAWLPPDGTE